LNIILLGQPDDKNPAKPQVVPNPIGAPKADIKPIEKPGKLELCVFEFKYAGPSKAGAIITSMLTEKINHPDYEVVNPSKIQKILEEKKIKDMLGLPASEAQEILKSASVEALLIGEIKEAFQAFRASYRLLYLDPQKPEIKEKIEACATWTLLKQKLLESLIKHGLYKIDMPQNGLGWHGEKLPPGLACSLEKGVYLWQKDQSEMVYIPAGTFLKGEQKESSSTPAYYIDRYEVTWEQYWKFYTTSGYEKDPMDKEPPKQLLHPAVYVSFKDAEAYCQWAGKVLPSELEWEKAARGTQGFLYPWGDQATEPLPACYPPSPDTRTIGSFAQGVSPFGCFDMAGNAAEWCADWYDPAIKYEKVLRGGSWKSPASALTTVTRRKQLPVFRLNFTGFRCVVRIP